MTQKELTRNNVILLTCLLAIMFFLPALSSHGKLLASALSSALIISSMFALDFPRRTRILLTSIGAIGLILVWLDFLVDQDLVRLIDYLFLFIYIVFITVTMIIHIARSKNVTLTLIISAVNGYFLLGYLGALLLANAEILQKFVFREETAAISFAGSAGSGFHDFLYFSFVTLTTLGYGDVTPVSHIAKSVTLIIAVSGQMYMTILIAMLVGKYLARSMKE